MAAPEPTPHRPTRGPSDTDDAPDRILQLPSNPTPLEAAAIATAIALHIRDGRDTDPQSRSAWDGHRWRYAGRLTNMTGNHHRIPRDLPPNPWTAAARIPRF